MKRLRNGKNAVHRGCDPLNQSFFQFLLPPTCDMPSGPAYDMPLERLRNGKNPAHRPLKHSFCQLLLLLLPTYDITFGTVVVVVVVVVVAVAVAVAAAAAAAVVVVLFTTSLP